MNEITRHDLFTTNRVILFVLGSFLHQVSVTVSWNEGHTRTHTLRLGFSLFFHSRGNTKDAIWMFQT